MQDLKALLWDVDGTLAETERDGHRVAFNLAFEALGLPWCWSESRYGELLRVTGGRERLLHDMAGRTDAPVPPAQREALARELHALKNRFYADIVHSGALPLRPGVAGLIAEARAAGVRQGIVTTTSRSNLDALLTQAFGPRWAAGFEVTVCGEDVQHKKPDPQAYLAALAALRLSPLETVAIEDSPGGVAAARAAEVPVLVPLSRYFADAIIDDAIAIGPDLGQRRGWRPRLEDACGDGPVTLSDIAAWRAEMNSLSHPQPHPA
ncbi:HAD-IA family hydrolase [Ideonella sp.]|uniref:HAD-IA family hydrolase n=1 Tax=Ideonella sp. TaxID=1929293 RepID=UPI0035AF892B